MCDSQMKAVIHSTQPEQSCNRELHRSIHLKFPHLIPFPISQTTHATGIIREHTTKTGKVEKIRSDPPITIACAYDVYVLILPGRQVPFPNGCHCNALEHPPRHAERKRITYKMADGSALKNYHDKIGGIVKADDEKYTIYNIPLHRLDDEA